MNPKPLNLHKAENPASYAKLANEGVLLGYPVKIAGQHARGDNGIHYHSTIKYFDPSKDHPHVIHNLAQHLPLNPPDAKNTQIKFDVFKDRLGNDVHTVTLHGRSADKLKEHNGKFAGMGFPATFEWTPHISVDKAQWDKLKASGAKTAHEAGIEFGPAQLKKGPKVLKTYHHKPDTTEPTVPDESDFTAKVNVNKSDKVCLPKKDFIKEHKDLVSVLRHPNQKNVGKEIKEQSEELKEQNKSLEKGALKTAGMALGMAGALANSSGHAGTKHGELPANHAGNRAPASIQPKTPSYDHQRMLNAIAQVESSNGKNVNHGVGGGPIHGSERAYGKYGLMPETIREVIGSHRDLKAKHGKALALKGDTFHKYMQDHKGLEDAIANRHLSHLEHRLGNNPDLLSYSWLNGAQGALNAKNSGQDIKDHWHVKKVRDAYGKGK